MTEDVNAPASTIQVQPNNLDQQLADLLSTELACDVTNHMAESDGPCDLIDRAVGTPGQAQIDQQQDQATVALLLPGGSVAVWNTSAENSGRSARHGQSLLALHGVQTDNQQLQSEVESLVAQVTNDFEELSLIRSLSCALALPTGIANACRDMVLATLTPLARGVGAESIAAILIDDDESFSEPLWSHRTIIPNEAIESFLETFGEGSAGQPIVRNQVQLGACQELNEFVVVQCRSEERVHGWMVACNRVDNPMEDVPWAQIGFTTVQASLMETATNQMAAQLHNLRLLKQKEDLFTGIVRALVNALDARDPYTCGHSERVALFARCLATLHGLPDESCERIYLTGLLHDVGKIAIPDHVLQKPSKLNEAERKIIETHTEAGWRILHELEAMQDVLVGVLYHHENFNGTGYPDKLAGDNIPIDGRILAVCDAFDAMTSDRPYRNGMTTAKATEILRGGAGSYWDADLVDTFLTNIDQIEQIRVGHQLREPAQRQPATSGLPTLSPLPLSEVVPTIA